MRIGVAFVDGPLDGVVKLLDDVRVKVGGSIFVLDPAYKDPASIAELDSLVIQHKYVFVREENKIQAKYCKPT